MRKFILITIIVFGIILSLYFFLKPKAEFEPVECFDYYKFGANFLSYSAAEKESYNAGDNATFFYTINNPMKIPITNLIVRVQMFYEGNETDRLEGNDLIDELVVLENVNLNPGDSYSGEFDWKIPKNMKSGTYLANFYLSSEYMFNLDGLSFLSNFGGSVSSFNVISDNENMIKFDRNSVYVNGTQYKFRLFAPMFFPDNEININAELINDGIERDVKIIYQVFKFDDLNPLDELKEYTQKEGIKLKQNSNTKISFNLKDLEPNVYLVKLTALTENQKSILNLRIPIVGEKERIVFLGLDKFPNIPKQSSVIFCLTNGAAPPGDPDQLERNVKIELVDKDKNSLFEGREKVIIDGNVKGYMFNFNLKKVQSYVTLKISVYDGDEVQEDMSIVYDYSKFWNITRKLDIDISNPTVELGKDLKFMVSFKDNLGGSLDGNLFVYVTDSSGKVMTIINENDFSENKETEIPVNFPKGQYELKVIEKNFEMSASKEFRVI